MINDLLNSRLKHYGTLIDELEAKLDTDDWTDEDHDNLESSTAVYYELEYLIQTLVEQN